MLGHLSSTLTRNLVVSAAARSCAACNEVHAEHRLHCFGFARTPHPPTAVGITDALRCGTQNGQAFEDSASEIDGRRHGLPGEQQRLGECEACELRTELAKALVVLGREMVTASGHSVTKLVDD